MAARRFSNFRRRGASSNFRSRRPRLRTPGSRRWEVSDFFVSSAAQWPTGNSTEQLLMLHLASIPMSLQNDVSPNVAGVALGAMTRKLLIGGIVMDYGWEFLGDLDGLDTATQGQAFMETGICSDTINFLGSAKGPNAINAWSPWQSGFPTAVLNAATTPALSVQEGDRPLHIHWRKKEATNFAARIIDNPQAETLYIPSQQPVRTRGGTVNRRLKLVLDDQQGLFVYFATLNSTTFSAIASSTLGLNRWAGGSLFWRYVF